MAGLAGGIPAPSSRSAIPSVAAANPAVEPAGVRADGSQPLDDLEHLVDSAQAVGVPHAVYSAWMTPKFDDGGDA